MFKYVYILLSITNMFLLLLLFLFPFFAFTDGNKSSDNRSPFNNEAYSAFKRGNVVKGILCPSLTNSFRSRSLERSYLTYSHRQRQKSLLIVNIVDLVLKIVLAICWIYRQSPNVVSKIGKYFAFFLVTILHIFFVFCSQFS